MKALVVGGAGFIGSHLVERLIADDDSVDVVDDLSTGGLANLADARAMGGTLKIHHLDARSTEAASLIGMRQPEVIYHLAAVPRRWASTMALAEAITTSVCLLDAARAHAVAKVVVALPAGAIYGRPAARQLPLKEDLLEPRGVRGVVARSTIDLLATYRETDAVEFTALALGTVYGRRQRPESGVVAALADAARSGRAPTITGDGRQTRDFVFVDDAVDAIVRSGTRGSGLVVNVGTGQQTSIVDLWSQLAGSNAVGPVRSGARPDELVRFALSPVRARIHLGWSPWTSLADGLRQL
jgi:UDP-glucose 4-epimerase